MNYKFLSVLAISFCMYTGVRASKAIPVAAPKEGMPSVLKIGYVDFGYILENLPEAKKNYADINSYQRQLDNQITSKIKEFQEKMRLFEQQDGTLTEAQKKQKRMEMVKLKTDCEGLEEQKYAKIEQKFNELIKPIHDRLHAIIDKIAQEDSYAFVLSKYPDVSPVVLFAQKSYDISERVLHKFKEMLPKEVPLPIVAPKKSVAKKGSSNPSVQAAKEEKKK